MTNLNTLHDLKPFLHRVASNDPSRDREKMWDRLYDSVDDCGLLLLGVGVSRGKAIRYSQQCAAPRARVWPFHSTVEGTVMM